MKTYVTANELGEIVGLHESTVHNRLINAGIIKRKDVGRGFDVLDKKREFCKIEYREGRYKLVFHFEEIRHYLAGMYRRPQT